MPHRDFRRKAVRSARQVGRFGTAAGALLILGALALTACTAPGRAPRASGPTASDRPASSKALQNPLQALEDPHSGDYVGDALEPLLERRDRGKATYPVSGMSGARGVTVYVSCAPQTEFTVRFLDNFYSGVCSPRFDAYASFPVPAGTTAAELRLEIAPGVDHYVVALRDE